MHPQLPPPDPHEGAGVEAPGLELAEPTMWFPNGAPTPEAERLAKLVLEHRPGALLVFDTR
jgi:hypothetical protein